MTFRGDFFWDFWCEFLWEGFFEIFGANFYGGKRALVSRWGWGGCLSLLSSRLAVPWSYVRVRTFAVLVLALCPGAALWLCLVFPFVPLCSLLHRSIPCSLFRSLFPWQTPKTGANRCKIGQKRGFSKFLFMWFCVLSGFSLLDFRKCKHLVCFRSVLMGFCPCPWCSWCAPYTP